jgi:hypothetical protein
VQRLRKSTGMVASDVVEIFYEVEEGKNAAAATKLIEDCIRVHGDTMRKRIRSVPHPRSEMSAAAVQVASEVVEDADICKGKFTLWLTQSAVSLDTAAVAAVAGESVDALVAEMQAMNYSELVALESVTLGAAGVTLQKGVHYFGSVDEKVASKK